MDKLIAKDKNDYEKIAVDLASNRIQLSEIRKEFKNKKKIENIFDREKLTKDLENIYSNLHEKLT